METYDQLVHKELFYWNKKMMQNSGLLHRLSKRAQTKVNEFIPEKVHRVVTESMKKVTQAALVPGIGAVVGAVANYHLLDHLGETAMNCYRLRLFAKEGQ
jgi:hypothetical protein